MSALDEVVFDRWEEGFVHPTGFCGLCGNSGVVDTRGTLSSSTGVECGVIAMCICPTGHGLIERGVKTTQQLESWLRVMSPAGRVR